MAGVISAKGRRSDDGQLSPDCVLSGKRAVAAAEKAAPGCSVESEDVFTSDDCCCQACECVLTTCPAGVNISSSHLSRAVRQCRDGSIYAARHPLVGELVAVWDVIVA